jgi:hypothetical protein
MSTDDYIWMYYNNSGATDVTDISGTYNDDYVGVWHLDETGSGTRYDSTSYNNDATTGGYNGDEAVIGKVYGADDFDGTNDYVYMHSVTTDLDDIFTVSLWMRAGSASDAGLAGFHSSTGGSNRWRLEMVADNANIETGSGTTIISDGKWHYLVGVTDGTKSMLYVNGQLELDNIAATTNLGDSDLASLAQEYDSGPVTSDHFDGTLDEVKISRVVRSASWINAQYLSMDNKFITFGEEETKGLDRGAAYIFFGYPGIDLNNISAAYANVTINGTFWEELPERGAV